MITQNLVLLLLGLMVMMALLRGLFVALQARRGQVRVAIARNIPQDVDLEALETAELPNGGARVVSRDFPAEEPGQHHPGQELDPRHDSDQPDLHQPPLDEQLPDHAASGADGLAGVQPDYPDGESVGESDVPVPDGTESVDRAYHGAGSPGNTPAVAEARPSQAVPGEAGQQRTDCGSGEPGEEAGQEAQQDPGPAFDTEAVLGEFSMTAGERIGYQGQADILPEAAGADTTGEDGAVPKTRRYLFGSRRGKAPESAGVGQEPGSNALPDNAAAQDPIRQDNKADDEAAGAASGKEAEGLPTSPDPQSSRPTDIRQPQPHSQPTEVRQQSPLTQRSEVIVLNVMAGEGQRFDGQDLLHAVITCGLTFGDMNIFHLRDGPQGRGPVVFSLANILNPGTFDLNNLSKFSTVGVSLFLALPAPESNFDAFERMLEVAQRLCHLLDGELRDDQRNAMTGQTVEHYRQRVRDFELGQLKAAGSRG